MDELSRIITENTGLSAETQTKILISVIIVIVLSLFRFAILRLVWRQTHNIKTRYQWKRTLSFIIPFIGFVFVGAVWLPVFEEFGTFSRLSNKLQLGYNIIVISFS